MLTAEEAKKIKEQKEETLRKAEEKTKKQRQRTRKKHLLLVNLVLPAPINFVLLAASWGGRGR